MRALIAAKYCAAEGSAFPTPPGTVSGIMSSVNRRALVSLVFPFLVFAWLGPVLVPANLHSQVSVPAPESLAPGPKPPDISPEWQRLVGIYRHNKDSVIILERDRNLFWKGEQGTEFHVGEQGETEFSVWFGDLRAKKFSSNLDTSGSVSSLTLGDKVYTRVDAGSDPAHFFQVTPLKPVSELRQKALLDVPPKEAGPFRTSDLVELTSLDPAFHLDIRYAQSDNFLSTPVYTQARAFMQRPAAEALQRVGKKLQPLGYGLLIHDAYRPWYVTKIFWAATPPKDHNFVADPKKGSKHNRGCAVDLTLYDLATAMPSEMPGRYDEMSPRSFPTFPGGTSLQRWHRDLLRKAMESEGFSVNEDEWWHFDFRDWKQYPILNVSFEDLRIQAVPAGR